MLYYSQKEKRKGDKKMFHIIRAFDIEHVSYERFLEIIDEEIAKGFHLVAVNDKEFDPFTFMVCYW